MSKKDLKFVGPKEVLEWGLLFEINRKVLHPLGLALAVEIDDEGNYSFSSEVWDCRDDPEGVVFSDESFYSGVDKLEKMFRDWGEDKLEERLKELGYVVQGQKIS